MSEFDDIQNAAQRKAEKDHPGYVGPVFGQFTAATASEPELPRRTEVSVAYWTGKGKSLKQVETTYWLDVPEGSILVGDELIIVEREELLTVTHVGTTLGGAYFMQDYTIPHKLGTFVQLERRARTHGE